MPYCIQLTPEVIVDVLLTGRRWRAGHIVRGLPKGSTFKGAEVVNTGLDKEPRVDYPILNLYFDHPAAPEHVEMIPLEIWTTVAGPEATMHLDDLFAMLQEHYDTAHLYIRVEKGQSWASAPVPDPNTYPQPETIKDAFIEIADAALALSVAEDLPEKGGNPRLPSFQNPPPPPPPKMKGEE